MVGIIIKKYEHLNKSFPKWDTPQGVHVKNKDHYDRLMKENNMVPYEDQKVVDKRKDYSLSPKARAIIQACKSAADSKGKIKSLGDNTIKAMQEIGAIGKAKEIPSYMQLPQHYQQGGFIK